MSRLPDRLSRESIIDAIRAYDAGVSHEFADSRLYDVLFEGRRYPPKAIVGIAASYIVGSQFTPQDFSGGVKSKCVKLLTDQGFKVIGKGKAKSGSTYADEVPPDTQYAEGAVMQVTVNRYERDQRARRAALKYHGYQCKVCDIDMSKVYGKIAEGFIHIHHLEPLHTLKERHHPDPKIDLIPVCPNCHAMLHRRDPPYTPAEIKAMMA